jgi:hypothetical protein
LCACHLKELIVRFILSLILAIAAGVGVGVALYFLDLQGFYLIIAMPIFAGSIVGFAAALPMLKRGAAVVPLALIATLGALLVLGGYWYLQYDAYNQAITKSIEDSGTQAKSSDVQELIAEYQQDEYGTTGFPAFLAEYAEVGFSVGRVGSSSGSSLEIKDNLAYIYWGIEGVIVVVAAVATAISRTRKEGA